MEVCMKNKRWWNNGSINRRSEDSPGEGFNEGRLPYPRKPHTPERKKNIAKSLIGKEPWNKNKKNVYSEETITKMRNAKEGFTPVNGFKKGNSPWNKGLTKETNQAVKTYTEKQKGQRRTGNYKSNSNWKGENNPWFGKNRSKENHPNYKGEKYKRDYIDYRNKVIWLSEKTYVENIQHINPNNYPRTISGVVGGYQLDHIYSIKKGFDNKISPEDISKKENLQMLPWKTNRTKSSK